MMFPQFTILTCLDFWYAFLFSKWLFVATKELRAILGRFVLKLRLSEVRHRYVTWSSMTSQTLKLLANRSVAFASSRPLRACG